MIHFTIGSHNPHWNQAAHLSGVFLHYNALPAEKSHDSKMHVIPLNDVYIDALVKGISSGSFQGMLWGLGMQLSYDNSLQHF